MSSLLDRLTENAEVSIETTLFPTVRFNVGESLKDDGAGPGLLSTILKPRVVVTKDGTQVYVSAPAGDPNTGPQWKIILPATALILLALYLVLR